MWQLQRYNFSNTSYEVYMRMAYKWLEIIAEALLEKEKSVFFFKKSVPCSDNVFILRQIIIITYSGRKGES